MIMNNIKDVLKVYIIDYNHKLINHNIFNYNHINI